MLDRAAIALLRPAMQRGAGVLHRHRIGADTVTWVGFAGGLAGAAAIGLEAYGLGLALILASRVCDGLDGALARLTQPTDRGAFFDIALDFMFYGSVPLGFACASPPANALAAATLLAAFIGTGSSFLAYAVFAERRGLRSDDYPMKGIFYLGGLTEASETLICFVLMCLFPAHFPTLAYAFAILCSFTIVTRLATAYRALD
jgi:phosphatidylglycerophosphate synthase